MPPEFALFPPRGSDLAGRVDALFYFGLFITAVFSLLIAGLIFYLGLKYRRRDPEQIGQTGRAAVTLEIVWCVVPLGIVLFLFAWGSDVFFELSRPPSDAVQYFVVGR